MTNTKTTTPVNRVERSGHLRWIPVAELRVDPATQRELRPGWAAQIAAEFNPDRFMPPLVSIRDHRYFVIDGQHRVEAMKIMGWGDQQIQCWTYEGLTQDQEADLFLWHNNRKAVGALEKFQIAVVADRDDETDINRIVLANGLKIGGGGKASPGSIPAVGALRKVYAHGPGVLGRTLRIVRDSYGDDGLRGHVIEGVGLLCAKYNGELNDQLAVQKLSTVRGGLGALNTKAAALRKSVGRPMAQCVAAAATEIINTGKGGKKLPNWWQ